MKGNRIFETKPMSVVVPSMSNRIALGLLIRTIWLFLWLVDIELLASIRIQYLCRWRLVELALDIRPTLLWPQVDLILSFNLEQMPSFHYFISQQPLHVHHCCVPFHSITLHYITLVFVWMCTDGHCSFIIQNKDKITQIKLLGYADMHRTRALQCLFSASSVELIFKWHTNEYFGQVDWRWPIAVGSQGPPHSADRWLCPFQGHPNWHLSVSACAFHRLLFTWPGLWCLCWWRWWWVCGNAVSLSLLSPVDVDVVWTWFASVFVSPQWSPLI